jgi:hypothetical protein
VCLPSGVCSLYLTHQDDDSLNRASGRDRVLAEAQIPQRGEATRSTTSS